jgi:zinc protease
MLSALAQKLEDPNYLASLNWNKQAFGNHPYARALYGTLESIPAITREDLAHHLATQFGLSVLHISAVGDITPAKLQKILNHHLSTIPLTAKTANIEPVNFPKGSFTAVPLELAQSVAVFGHEGIGIHEKDYYAASIVNYILGGGGFESRLMNNIREKNGLAYSVYTFLNPMDYANVFRGAVGTRPDAMDKSLTLIKQDITSIAQKGITQEELDSAKDYLTGSFVLSLDSTVKIADILNEMQIEDLGLDYLEKRNENINRVTLDEANAAAQRLFNANNLIIVVVGKHKAE